MNYENTIKRFNELVEQIKAEENKVYLDCIQTLLNNMKALKSTQNQRD